VSARLPSPGWKRSKTFFFTGRGFTLLEVLVTITLTGFILLGILTVLQNTAVFSWRSYTRGDKERVIRLLTRRLEETLNSAYFCPYLGVELPLLTGDPQGFSLPVCREGVPGRAGYFLRDGDLIYRWEGIRDGEVTEEAVVTRLPGGAFSYLDGKTGIWLSLWREEYYPRLVRLRLNWREAEVETEATGLLPDLIFPVLVGTEYGIE
jgi:prepilin-type N-terminal cleavage/methylation domain-containing protein